MTPLTSATLAGPAARRSSASIVALCFVIIVHDGYDLVVYGATVPSLLAYEPWHLNAGQVGAIGSYALGGMLLGALLSGWLSPRIGARTIVLGRVGAIFGPILGGWIASSALGVEWNFYTFAAFAALGCIAVGLVSCSLTPTPARPVAALPPTPFDHSVVMPAPSARS